MKSGENTPGDHDKVGAEGFRSGPPTIIVVALRHQEVNLLGDPRRTMSSIMRRRSGQALRAGGGGFYF